MTFLAALLLGFLTFLPTNASLRRASSADSTISLACVYFMAFLSVLWVFEPVYMVLEDVIAKYLYQTKSHNDALTSSWQRHRKEVSMPCIYLVRLNGEPKYIGYTKRTIKQRWHHHCYDAKHGSTTLLHEAIRTNPPESFSVEEVHRGDDPSHVLAIMEPKLINEWKTHYKDGGFNMNHGGKGCSEVCEMTRRRMSVAKIGKRVSNETRKRMSDAKRGSKIHRTKEHNERIASATRGRVVSEETRKRMSESQQRRRMKIPNLMELVRQFGRFRYCDGDY